MVTLRAGKRSQSQVLDALTKRAYITLRLDGRRLFYFHTPRVQNQIPDFSMQGPGGALVNLLSLEFDKRLDWNSQEICAEVHHELVVQAPRERALEVKG